MEKNPNTSLSMRMAVDAANLREATIERLGEIKKLLISAARSLNLTELTHHRNMPSIGNCRHPRTTRQIFHHMSWQYIERAEEHLAKARAARLDETPTLLLFSWPWK